MINNKTSHPILYNIEQKSNPDYRHSRAEAEFKRDTSTSHSQKSKTNKDASPQSDEASDDITYTRNNSKETNYRYHLKLFTFVLLSHLQGVNKLISYCM